MDRVQLGMDCLADERASGGITHGDAHELLEGLLLGHLVGLGALLLHGRAGGLGRGGGGRGGLVLGGLEERHGWIVVFDVVGVGEVSVSAE